jgi:hypothetical protein
MASHRRSAWSQVRRSLYFTQRTMGDASAAARGPAPLAKRLIRRSVRRSIFRMFS